MAFDPTNLVRDFGDVDGEARACRSACALFDFSFMARARIEGPAARATLARFQPRPVDDLALGRIRYALRLNAHGAVAADLTIWNLGDGVYEVMSGRRQDIADLAALAPPGASCRDLTEETAIFAVQGPHALAALAAVADAGALATLPYFGASTAEVAGVACLIGRLGYTGERGFEIVAPRAAVRTLWGALARRARPAGFAAADILRIEAGFMLFVNECRLSVTPAELGLAKFAGSRAGTARVRLVGFEAECGEHPILWRAPAETELPRAPGEIAITSACRSVVFDRVIGLGFVNADDAVPGRTVHDPRGWFRAIRLVSLPPYDPEKRRPRGGWSVADLSPLP
jgi:glycine cleavage system aminomethyltransferase T